MYDVFDRLSPGWQEPYLDTLRKPLTLESRKKIQELKKQLDALPDEEAN